LETQKKNEHPKTKIDVFADLVDVYVFDEYMRHVMNGEIVIPEDGNDEKEFEEFLKEYLSGEIVIEEAADSKVSIVRS
jgi:hypothetical protein